MGRRVSQQEVDQLLTNNPSAKLWVDLLNSRHTKIYAGRDLIRYCEFHHKTPEQLLDLKRNQKDNDAEKLLDQFVAAETFTKNMVARIVKYVRSFYSHNYLDLSRKAGRKAVKVKVKPYYTPTAEDLRALEEVCGSLRDKALIRLLTSGLRRGSIPFLKWGNIWKQLFNESGNLKWDRKTPVHISLMSLELKGSGNRNYNDVEQHTFLYPNAVEILLRLKSFYEKWKRVQVQPQFPLIPTRRKYEGKFLPLSEGEVGKLIVRMSHRANLSISPHDIRRYVQTELEEARVPANWVKKILGHKLRGEENPYSRPKIEKLRQAFTTAIPYLDYTQRTDLVGVSSDVEKLKEELSETKSRLEKSELTKNEFLKTLRGRPKSELEDELTIASHRGDLWFEKYNELAKRIEDLEKKNP